MDTHTASQHDHYQYYSTRPSFIYSSSLNVPCIGNGQVALLLLLLLLTGRAYAQGSAAVGIRESGVSDPHGGI